LIIIANRIYIVTPPILFIVRVELAVLVLYMCLTQTEKAVISSRLERPQTLPCVCDESSTGSKVDAPFVEEVKQTVRSSGFLHLDKKIDNLPMPGT
jgi:hypothetical protein